MNTIITTRHCEIPETLKERAEAISERLGQFAARAVECTVLFENDHQQAICEVRLHVAGGKRGKVLIAQAEGVDHRTALDRAEVKLRNQLDKPPRRSRPRVKADQA